MLWSFECFCEMLRNRCEVEQVSNTCVKNLNDKPMLANEAADLPWLQIYFARLIWRLYTKRKEGIPPNQSATAA